MRNLLRIHIDNLGYSIGELAKLLITTEVELPELYDTAELPGTTLNRNKGLRVIN